MVTMLWECTRVLTMEHSTTVDACLLSSLISFSADELCTLGTSTLNVEKQRACRSSSKTLAGCDKSK